MKASANNKAVRTILNFTPLKKDSTTFFDDCAPAYLNAFKAKNMLGTIATTPPEKADLAWVALHIKYIIIVPSNTIPIENNICARAIFRPTLVNLLFIITSKN